MDSKWRFLPAANSSPGDDIEATITLWYGNRVMGSWSASGSTALGISGSVGVVKGEKYTLKVTGSIAGVSFDAVKISGTC